MLIKGKGGKVKTTFRDFRLCSKFTGGKPNPLCSEWVNYNCNVVSVINEENNLFTRFEYWGTNANPEIETRRDLLDVFLGFVDDAISGKMDYEEFCSTLGLDKEELFSRNMYSHCRKCHKKLSRIFDGDFYELADALHSDVT